MKVRKALRTSLNNLGKYKMYFLRGHNSWFYFVFWLVSFTTIIYKLLLEDLTLPDWMKFSYFFIFFILVYIPIAVIIGRFDYRRGTFRGEVNLSLEVNPIIQKQFQNQELIISEQRRLSEELEKIKEMLKNV